MIPSARENLLWCGLIGLAVLNPFAIAAAADFDGDSVSDTSDLVDDNDGVPDFA